MAQGDGPPPGGGGVKRKIPNISGYVKQLRRFIVKSTDENKKMGELSLPKREIAIRKSLGTSKEIKIGDPVTKVKCDRFGDHLLITVVDDEQAKKMMNLKKIRRI